MSLSDGHPTNSTALKQGIYWIKSVSLFQKQAVKGVLENSFLKILMVFSEEHLS